jgi:hypothetical protein
MATLLPIQAGKRQQREFFVTSKVSRKLNVLTKFPFHTLVAPLYSIFADKKIQYLQPCPFFQLRALVIAALT